MRKYLIISLPFNTVVTANYYFHGSLTSCGLSSHFKTINRNLIRGLYVLLNQFALKAPVNKNPGLQVLHYN